MKKLIVLLVVMMFGISAPAFAAKAVLSDKEMGDINAGDWVVLTDEAGGQTVADVYRTNNTLDLYDVGQKTLEAVNNGNAVDSAIAMSTNVARVTMGEAPISNQVSQTNIADIKNARPKDTVNETSKHVATFEVTTVSSTDAKHNAEFTLNSSASSGFESASGSAYDENLDITNDENVAASLAIASSDRGDKISGGGSSSVAGALVATKDFDLDYTKVKSDYKSAEANCEKKLDIVNKESCSLVDIDTKSIKSAESCETSRDTSTSQGANNHLVVANESQMLLKAVGNLNAVASGAAVQANIASNVGVTGGITQVNSATVASGL